jgi:hypothetical protein
MLSGRSDERQRDYRLPGICRRRRRPIYLDSNGQYVLDDEAQRVYGVYQIPEEERCDPPVIVEGVGRAARQATV